MSYSLTLNSGTYATGSYVQPRVVVDAPVLWGAGPPDFSSDTRLASTPTVIWDANYYYRSLGFSWPFLGITKNMLMKAYMARVGPTQSEGDFAFMTYSLSQLLNARRRRAYDRMQLGERMVDRYIWLALRRKFLDEVRRRTAAGEEVNNADIYEDMGVGVEPNEPVVDGDTPLGDSERDHSASEDDADTVPETWPWGYYLWRSSCQDTELLARWQGLLLAAARERGLRVSLAIGFVGHTGSRMVVAQLGSCYACLLSDQVEPDEGLAAYAVEGIVQQLTR